MSKITSLDIIIPIYNALDYTKFCIESIIKFAKNDNEIKTSIILVNDNSNKETTEYLRETSQNNSNFLLINNEENLGFVKTCNKGLAQSNSDISILLNTDTVIPPNFIEKIINCFASDEKIGIASPIASASNNFYIPIYPGYTFFEMAQLISDNSEHRYPNIVSPEGFCYCIKKDVIEQQGYLDEIYGRGYYEESDYAMRALNNGWKTVCIDDLYVYHRRHVSFKSEVDSLKIKNKKIFNTRWEKLKLAKSQEYNQPHPLNYLREKFEIHAPHPLTKSYNNKKYNIDINPKKSKKYYYKHPIELLLFKLNRIKNKLLSFKKLEQTSSNITYKLDSINETEECIEVINNANTQVMNGSIVRIYVKHKSDYAPQLLSEPLLK